MKAANKWILIAEVAYNLKKIMKCTRDKLLEDVKAVEIKAENGHQTFFPTL